MLAPHGRATAEYKTSEGAKLARVSREAAFLETALDPKGQARLASRWMIFASAAGGVERGRTIVAPARNAAAIVFGPAARPMILTDGKTAWRSRTVARPSSSTSTTITRTSRFRFAAASNAGSAPLTTVGFRLPRLPLTPVAAVPARTISIFCTGGFAPTSRNPTVRVTVSRPARALQRNV